MLGLSDASVQGKRTRTQPDAVVDKVVVDLPPTIIEYYWKIELSIDVLHVNRIPFLTLISKNIHYGTVNALNNMKIPTMEDCIDKILRAYGIRGFHVTAIHVDIQFKSIKDRNRLDLVTNVVSWGEHVPEIERHQRVLKERARCYFAMLLKIDITTIPRTMVIHLMQTGNFCVNAFVWKRVVS